MRARIFSAFFLSLLALAVVGFSAPAPAQPYGPPRDAQGGGVQPLDRLLPGIRRAHPGDFYDAEGPTWGPSGDPHYHLKWMTPDGRVVWFDADARNGRVLRSSPGRDSFDGRGPPPPGYARPYGPGGYGPTYPTRRYGPGGFEGGRGYARPWGGGYGGRGGWRGGRGHR